MVSITRTCQPASAIFWPESEPIKVGLQVKSQQTCNTHDVIFGESHTRNRLPGCQRSYDLRLNAPEHDSDAVYGFSPISQRRDVKTGALTRIKALSVA